MILGLFLPLLLLVTILYLQLKLFIMMFSPWEIYGPDGVPPIVLKNCAFVHAPCLAKLFQLCLLTSSFPSCWKFAYIQPVPKKGDRSNPSNYGLIALLSCLFKVFLIYPQ
ncbi:hypothetical protein E2C01_005524 [Portunus trituberculatus]|uniref:Uncharacterized protein n=1 Tax=Portunus trituberculatus TaxID=210409 RepID=A0A5B7CVR3_PORTR|nr:hypothetical protein [Portunus trituberculatus]